MWIFVPFRPVISRGAHFITSGLEPQLLSLCSRAHELQLLKPPSLPALGNQARLQQHVHQELPDVQAGFRKDRGTRGQIANTCWIIEKAREFQKNVYFCFIDYAKAFDCVPLSSRVATRVSWSPLSGLKAMSSSKCGFLACIQISQEADQVVRYSHLLKNFQIGRAHV